MKKVNSSAIFLQQLPVASFVTESNSECWSLEEIMEKDDMRPNIVLNMASRSQCGNGCCETRYISVSYNNSSIGHIYICIHVLFFHLFAQVKVSWICDWTNENNAGKRHNADGAEVKQPYCSTVWCEFCIHDFETQASNSTSWNN